MKLYSFPIAPNPTRVRLVLAEKAEAGAPIPIETVTVNLGRGEQNSAAHRARNPLGALPVLELDDGRFLTESLAIIEYLDEQYPEPPLLGRDPLERARVRELERIAELRVLSPIAYVVHTTRSPLGLPPVPRRRSRHDRRLHPRRRAAVRPLRRGRPRSRDGAPPPGRLGCALPRAPRRPHRPAALTTPAPQPSRLPSIAPRTSPSPTSIQPSRA